MSFGKMNSFIKVIQSKPDKDADGFKQDTETVLAELRAYIEERRGTETWANRASFSTATVLFRFRKQPGLEISTSHLVECSDGKYRILSVEDVKGRGMYIELLAEKIEPSMR